ncbi:hypothetical protein M9458_039430, partial [Cirrhinus mrigala]
ELEEMAKELGPLHDQLDFKVARLGRGLDDSIPDLLLRAEDHAGQLNDSAAILD